MRGQLSRESTCLTSTGSLVRAQYFAPLWGVGGMADTLDLGSSASRRKGSSPLLPTRESVSFLISTTCYGLVEVKPDFKMTQISHSHHFNGHQFSRLEHHPDKMGGPQFKSRMPDQRYDFGNPSRVYNSANCEYLFSGNTFGVLCRSILCQHSLIG